MCPPREGIIPTGYAETSTVSFSDSWHLHLLCMLLIIHTRTYTVRDASLWVASKFLRRLPSDGVRLITCAGLVLCRFVCRSRIGGRDGESAVYMKPVPAGAVVYGSGEAAVILTKVLN